MSVISAKYSSDSIANWRAIAIFLFPVFAGLGSYLLPIVVGGVNFFAFRALVLLSLLGTFLAIKKVQRTTDFETVLFFCLGYVWVFWGCISYYWVYDKLGALKETFIIFFGFTVALTLLRLGANTKGGLTAITRGWLCSYIISAAIAVWELLTGLHLPSYTAENKPDYFLSRVVLSTYDNPNNYAAFILLSLPFIMLLVVKERGALKLISIAALVSSPFFMFLTESRLGFGGMLVEFLIFFYLTTIKDSFTLKFMKMVFCASVIFSMLYIYGGNIISKFQNIKYETKGSSSTTARANLSANGLDLYLKSFGMGTGAGSFQDEIRDSNDLLPTGDIVDPHNFYIEILSQYGTVVFALFVFWYCRCFYRAVFSFVTVTDSEIFSKSISAVSVVGMSGYFFASLANSAYIPQSTNWMFLSTIVVAISYLKKQPFRTFREL